MEGKKVHIGNPYVFVFSILGVSILASNKENSLVNGRKEIPYWESICLVFSILGVSILAFNKEKNYFG